MNPLDKEEFADFLQTMKKDMPIHTYNTAKIKGSSSQGLPKNLMEYSASVNNKFLNDNLHIIEEMEYRKKGITDGFRNYQNKYYNGKEILNHDLYFTYEGKTYPKVSGAALMGIKNIGFVGSLGVHVNGGDLVTNLGEYGPTPIGGGPYTVICNKVKTVGVVGEYYNQIAISCTSASGTLRMCAYDDSTGPNNRYVTDTGEFTAAANYAFHSLTEFPLVTATNWLAYSQSATSVSYNYETQASGNLQYLAGTYGELADPVLGSLISSTTVITQKLGHS